VIYMLIFYFNVIEYIYTFSAGNSYRSKLAYLLNPLSFKRNLHLFESFLANSSLISLIRELF